MINIGRILYGYCNGFFGRDSYEDKIIIGEGYDWVVCRYVEDKGYPVFAFFENSQEKEEKIELWSFKKGEES